MHQKKIRFIFEFVTVISLLIPFRSTSLAQAIERPSLKIVQLGDSYSAGNGARSASDEPNYYSVSDCYRSPTNWGSQFAESPNSDKPKPKRLKHEGHTCACGPVQAKVTKEDLEKTFVYFVYFVFKNSCTKSKHLTAKFLKIPLLSPI